MSKSLDSSEPDRAEFLERFLAIQTSLYRYVCAVAPVPQDARDIVQETALELWKHDGRYDPTRPFLPWALRVARNKARQHAEKSGRFPRLLEDEALLDLIASEQAETEPALEERQVHLKDCLESLRPDHARLIQGYYWQGNNITELADNHKTSIEGAYKRLQRIRAILLKCVLRREGKEVRA